MKQSKEDQGPPGIRNGVWLSTLGVTLLGIIAVSLPRKGTINEPSEQSFEVATAVQHFAFAKIKDAVEPVSYSANEIDAIDFSMVNDRSHWVDPTWLP